MKKTVFPSMSDMVTDYNKVEQSLRDIRTVLCCIAWQQDDRTLIVPVSALEEMPKGVALDVHFDRIHDNYVFRAVVPDAPADTTPTPPEKLVI